MGILRKTEDIFKPASKKDLTSRKKDLEKQRIEKMKQRHVRMQTATCPHCNAPLLQSGIREVWDGYATITQDYEWEQTGWEKDGDDEYDFGEGDTYYHCGKCNKELDLGVIGIPDPSETGSIDA